MDDMESVYVQLATLSGKLDTVIARMEAGDRNSAQLVTLVKDQLTYQAADIGEVKANFRENALKQDSALSAVRVDLEAKINVQGRDIADLQLWKARIGGIAAASAMFSSVLTGAVIKVIGA